ncbi:MAG: hypothetical protein HOH43_19535 [Candidatus Latescibacteria bacterium]|jgi:hypothetical protein|nr:hypothetical protein [Lentisphaerota bacterium]MBT5875625.1 hypothetical protein [Candidatus Latescibacterota bacterium]
MDKIHDITRRIERIKAELAALGDMRPGSLSVQSRSWGGEYAQLSYTHRGKGHTEYVRKEKRDEVERQVESYRRFRELTKEWVDLAIEVCKLRAGNGSDG